MEIRFCFAASDVRVFIAEYEETYDKIPNTQLQNGTQLTHNVMYAACNGIYDAV